MCIVHNIYYRYTYSILKQNRLKHQSQRSKNRITTHTLTYGIIILGIYDFTDSKYVQFISYMVIWDSYVGTNLFAMINVYIITFLSTNSFSGLLAFNCLEHTVQLFISFKDIFKQSQTQIIIILFYHNIYIFVSTKY